MKLFDLETKTWPQNRQQKITKKSTQITKEEMSNPDTNKRVSSLCLSSNSHRDAHMWWQVCVELKAVLKTKLAVIVMSGSETFSLLFLHWFPFQKDDLQDMIVAQHDGYLKCEFTRPKVMSVVNMFDPDERLTFDLDRDYYVMVAWGPIKRGKILITVILPISYAKVIRPLFIVLTPLQYLVFNRTNYTNCYIIGKKVFCFLMIMDHAFWKFVHSG